MRAMRESRGDELCICGCGEDPGYYQRTDNNAKRKRFLVVGHRVVSGSGGPIDKRDGYYNYKAAKSRCENPNRNGYADYGGSGVEFRFGSFCEFISHIGPKPSPIHSVDRINSLGHYEAGNVRWATPTEQIHNSRNCKLCQSDADNIRMLILAGFSDVELAAQYGVSKCTIYGVRINRSWKTSESHLSEQSPPTIQTETYGEPRSEEGGGSAVVDGPAE